MSKLAEIALSLAAYHYLAVRASHRSRRVREELNKTIETQQSKRLNDNKLIRSRARTRSGGANRQLARAADERGTKQRNERHARQWRECRLAASPPPLQSIACARANRQIRGCTLTANRETHLRPSTVGGGHRDFLFACLG